MTYKEIIDLGFTESVQNDQVYFNEFGYHYSIIELTLTDELAINWYKNSQTQEIFYLNKEQTVLNKRLLSDKELLSIIDFFRPIKTK